MIPSIRKAPRAWLTGAAGVAWLAWAYSVLLDLDPVYRWHLPLYAITLVLTAFPRLLRPRGSIQPRPLHFVLTAVGWSVFVAMPLASLLRGANSANVFMICLLWFGGCTSLALTWSWLLRRHAWQGMPLFLVLGLVALTEPGFVLARLVAGHDWQTVAVLLPVLHAAHATLLFPVANAYRTALVPRGASPPGPAGYLLAITASGAAFLLGSLIWFALARGLVTILGK